MNGTASEREGEEFPRLHACSTIDRPLKHTHGPRHGLGWKGYHLLMILGYFELSS